MREKMTLSDSKKALRYELTFQDVIHILRLVDQCPFQELQIELADGLKLRLETRRKGTPPPLPTSPEPSALAPREKGDPSAVAMRSVAGSVAAAPETVDGVEVASVSGGIFYRASGPGDPPYTEVGRAVNAGDTLGLIEVMKLFTPVTAPVAGKVTAIRVANEEVVKAGQVLIVIAPASD